MSNTNIQVTFFGGARSLEKRTIWIVYQLSAFKSFTIMVVNNQQKNKMGHPAVDKSLPILLGIADIPSNMVGWLTWISKNFWGPPSLVLRQVIQDIVQRSMVLAGLRLLFGAWASCYQMPTPSQIWSSGTGRFSRWSVIETFQVRFLSFYPVCLKHGRFFAPVCRNEHSHHAARRIKRLIEPVSSVHFGPLLKSFHWTPHGLRFTESKQNQLLVYINSCIYTLIYIVHRCTQHNVMYSNFTWWMGDMNIELNLVNIFSTLRSYTDDMAGCNFYYYI